MRKAERLMNHWKKILWLCSAIGLCLLLTACYIPPDEITDDGGTGTDAGNVLNFRTIAPTSTPTPRPTEVPEETPASTYDWGWGTSAPTGITPPPGITAPMAETTPPLRTFEVITSRPTATPRPTASSLKRGSTGAEVRKVQQRLKDLGYYTGPVDGDFGEATEKAVKAFQKANKLTADGKVGSQTLNKLNSSTAVKATATKKPTATPRPTTKPTPTRRPTATPRPTQRPTATPKPTSKPSTNKYLRSGASGSDVRILQNRLISLGWLAGSADGKYGAGTEAAVRAFQKAARLWDDGVAGPDTLEALYSSGAPRASNAAASIGEKLQEGSEGQGVRALQKRLKELGYYKGSVDGSYGRETTAAVMSFQMAHGLTVDGIAGVNTQGLIYGDSKPASTPTPRATPRVTSGSSSSPSSSSSISSTGYITLEDGSAGEQVRRLQTRLRDLGFYSGAVDGKYGSATVTAVINFQKSRNLTVDGKAGPATQRALYSTSSGRTTYATIYPGSRGTTVSNLQYTLYELGYYDGSVDGIYGNTTTDAVLAFQIRNRLTADGVAGNDTLQVLYSSRAIPENAPNSTYQKLELGDVGEAVLELKDALIQLGYMSSTSSSVYDDATEGAVRLFQLNNGLDVDGVAGPATQKLLYSANPVPNH